jgi:hypothetical protein
MVLSSAAVMLKAVCWLRTRWKHDCIATEHVMALLATQAQWLSKALSVPASGKRAVGTHGIMTVLLKMVET